MNNKNQNNFYKKLRHDILKQFGLLSIILTVLVIIILSGVLFWSQYYRLDRAVSNIQSIFYEITHSNETFLLSLNDDRFSVPNTTTILNNIYGSFYSNENRLKNDILVYLNREGEIIFSTNDTAYVDNKLQQYLKSIKITDKEGNLVNRVVSGMDGNIYYLVLLIEDNLTRGVFITSNDILSVIDHNDVSFTLADRFNNILTSNNDEFIANNNIKINSDIYKNTLQISEGNVVLLKSKEILPNIYLYSHINLFPISIIAALILSILMIIMLILFYQAQSISDRVAKRNSRNIDDLVKETYLVSNGYKNKIYINSEDEFHYLAQEINQMISRITNLYNRVLEVERDKTVYERKMLESQINPHFLYNTLETIRLSSYMDTDLTDRLVLSLNNVLRYSLDGDTLTKLSTDIDILKDFLSINKVRFEKFDYSIRIEDSLLDIFVPRLFLMPLIENSIKYGMKYREDLMIEIKIHKEDGVIKTLVKDNGPGFGRQKIQDIKENINCNHKTYHGINNSFRRLNITYENVELIIRSNEFTVVGFSFSGGIKCIKSL